MSERQGRAAPESDGPPEDLIKERDAFIQQFFRKGAQLTEELLRENHRLREQAAHLESENLRLRAYVASEDAIRELVKKIERLEEEKRELLKRTAQADAAVPAFESRYAEVENELANLANLYIAISQLHGARSVRGVVRNLRELLSQLIGAAAFAIYLYDEHRDELVAIASEGVPKAEIERVSATSGAIARAYTSGEPSFSGDTRDPRRGTASSPAAVVPMLFDGKPVGAIAIFSTLSQKSEFVGVDAELFKMLGAQAATAIAAAHLTAQSGRQMPSVQALADLED